jgi:repressor LexA
VLTTRQQEIWQFLVEYVDGHGYPPTVREIGDPTKPRAVELVGHRSVEAARAAAPEPDIHRLPLLGRVAAGGPLLADEYVEDVLAVPEPLGRGADFLLTVKGDSMVDAGILDGDTVVVQRADEASATTISPLLASSATTKQPTRRR